MDQVYDLQAPPPDPDIVDRHLAINNDILAGVANALPTRIDDALMANGQAIAPIESRMQRSAGTLLNQNTQALRPAMAALQGQVDAALAGNGAALDQLPPSVKVATQSASANPALLTADGNPTAGTWVVWSNDYTGVKVPQPSTQAQPVGVGWRVVDAGLSQAQAFALAGTLNPPGSIPAVPAPMTTPMPTPAQPVNTGPAPITVSTVPPLTTNDGVQGSWYCLTSFDGVSYSGFVPVGSEFMLLPSAGVNSYSGPYASQDVANAACNAQAPTPPTVQYYCASFTTYDGNTQYQVFDSNAIGAAVADGWKQVSGPYPDQGTAIAACKAPPTTIPPIGQPPTPLQYWCAYVKMPDGSTTYNVFDSTAIDQKVQQGWTKYLGPFADFLTAQIACFGASQVPQQTPAACQPGTLPLYPNWCSVNVCDTIDAISGATEGKKTFDVFDMLAAGTQENIGPAGTWLNQVRQIALVGESFYSVIATVGCKLNATINAAIAEDTQAKDGLVPVAVVFGVLDFLSKWFGLGLGDTKTKFGYWLNYLSPTTIPTQGETDELFQRNIISQEQWTCYTRANNTCEQPHFLVAQAGLHQPDIAETIKLHRLEFIDDPTYEKLMTFNKVGDRYAMYLAEKGYDNYPNAPDIIRFMTRDVFDPAVVTSAGLDKEFPEKWVGEAKTLGYAAGVNDDLALLHWRAHWVLPSMSQTFEMVRRLRPGRVAPSLEFTQADALQLMGVNDTAPGYRDRLLSISYAPLPIRAIRGLYDTHQLTTAEVGERYQDQGYSADDAALFSRQEEILRNRRLAAAGKGFTPAVISKALQANAMSDAEARHHMLRLGYSGADVDNMEQVAALERRMAFALAGEKRAMALALRSTLSAYEVGSIGRPDALAVLQQQGYSTVAATVTLNALDLSSRTSVAKTLVGRVRQGVLKGEVSLGQGEQALVAAGIDPARAQEYVASWTLLLSPKRKLLSGQQVLKMLREGILTREQASQRLSNLGFNPDDTQLLIVEVAYQTNQAQTRLQVASDKQRARAAAALLRESNRLNVLADKTRKQLCKQTPPALLRRWYAVHQIDSQYVIDSLSCQGYTPQVIDEYLRDFNDARTAKDAKKAAQAAKATATTTNGTAGTGSAGGTTPAG